MDRSQFLELNIYSWNVVFEVSDFDYESRIVNHHNGNLIYSSRFQTYSLKINRVQLKLLGKNIKPFDVRLRIVLRDDVMNNDNDRIMEIMTTQHYV